MFILVLLIIGIILFIKILEVHIIFNMIGSVLIALLLNFLFKDYLGLREVFKSFVR